jgi:branched-chain amino acid transport system ATP-binding protein
MTVEENVRLGAYSVRDAELVEQRCRRVKEIFPLVGNSWRTTAGLLSGGQQKQVEFARALMLEPVVVLLDEPSMGLDPKTTTTVFQQIERMREIGVAVMLVEQNARRALEMADVGCVLDLGRIHKSGPARQLLADPALSALYLGGSAARTATTTLTDSGA